MPVIITFDIKGSKNDANHWPGRLQSMFERFGWQNIGGTTYRYPRHKSGSHSKEVEPEDWFNHVIPALMLFRTFAIHGCGVSNFTLEAHSSTYGNSNCGKLPTNTDILEDPTSIQFGKRNLEKWLNDLQHPYPDKTKKTTHK